MSNSLQPTKPTKLLCHWGFSLQEYWSGLPCPPPGYLPKPGIEPRSPTWPVDSLLFEPPVYSKHILFVLAILVSKRFILYGKAFQTTLYCILSVWFHQLMVEIYILAENIEKYTCFSYVLMEFS